MRHRDRADCPAQRVGRTVAGRYTIVRLVGTGGTATVFKAQNTAIGRFVALKILHPHLRSHVAAIERFEREGRAMSRVRHQGVVDVLDLTSTDDGLPMLVLEYVRARTLAAEIRRSGPFALARAVDLTGQLLAVLAVVHEQRLVHRDIKPTNLLVGVDTRRRERLKLADFGLAASLDRATEQGDSHRVRMTPPGRVVATPRYLAPELLRGSDGVDPRVDIYGAGLVMFEMLTGRPAFESEHLDDLADAILHGHSPSVAARVRDVPPGIDEIIARALARHPGERFPNAQTMLDALRPFGAVADVIDAEPTDTNVLAPRNSLPAVAYAGALHARRSSGAPALAPLSRHPSGLPHSSSPPRVPPSVSPGAADAAPGSPGIEAARTLHLDPDPLSTESALADLLAARGSDIAAVIVEPVAGSMGVIAPRGGYLQEVKRLAHQHGA
ncbi:MAG: aminotransferase class III-fold pyridoxal phosphate-dependent enzyme, partial [Deltaproteobacteria bacterium]